MSVPAGQGTATRMLFRIGWWVLVVVTSLLALNHIVGSVAFAASDDERMMFIGFAALGVLSLVVLLVPYRARARWAWWASWVQIVTVALTLVVFGAGGIGWAYLVIALVMAAAQFATLPGFGARGAER